jgi:hypothetical protein
MGDLTMNRWRQRLAEIDGDGALTRTTHDVQNVQNVQNSRPSRHFVQIEQIEQRAYSSAPPTAPQVEIARPNNRDARLAEISCDAALPKALKAAVQRWINDHFTPSPPGVCVHCREGTRADDPFVLMFVASDRADVHSSCHAAWRAEREAEAVAALDLKESA